MAVTTTTTTTATDNNQGNLATFEPTSVRCMTRQEECLLKTALALTIVKDRWKHRDDQQQTTKKAPPSSSSSSFLDSTTVGQSFQEARETTQSPNPPRLLKQVHSSHLNHLFQVACRLASTSSSSRSDQHDGHSRTTTSDRTLVGVASHLTQQLCAWWETSQHATADTTTSNDKISQEISVWISSSLISHTHAGRVHQAMIQHASSSCPSSTGLATAALLNLWWSVTTTMLHQVYQHSFPISHSNASSYLNPAIASEQGTTTNTNTQCQYYSSWEELERSPFCPQNIIQEGTTQPNSPQGLELLAITLLQVLETLVLAWQRSPAVSTSGIPLPECFQDVLLPLPSPQHLGQEYWNMQSQQRRERVLQQEEPSSLLQPLSVATKLLVRLELYRILLLLPHGGPAVVSIA